MAVPEQPLSATRADDINAAKTSSLTQRSLLDRDRDHASASPFAHQFEEQH